MVQVERAPRSEYTTIIGFTVNKNLVPCECLAFDKTSFVLLRGSEIFCNSMV